MFGAGCSHLNQCSKYILGAEESCLDSSSNYKRDFRPPCEMLHLPVLADASTPKVTFSTYKYLYLGNYILPQLASQLTCY